MNISTTVLKSFFLLSILMVSCAGRKDDPGTKKVDDLTQFVGFKKVSSLLKTDGYNRFYLELEFELINVTDKDILALIGEIQVTNLLGEYAAFYEVRYQDTLEVSGRALLKLETRFDPEGRLKIDESTVEKLKFYWKPEKVVLVNGQAFIGDDII